MKRERSVIPVKYKLPQTPQSFEKNLIDKIALDKKNDCVYYVQSPVL